MRILLCLFVGTFLLGFSQEGQAQRMDYIILYDTIYREGKIESLPSNNLTEINFRRSRRDQYQTYLIEDISELRYNGRKFHRKEITVNANSKQVFLEKLPDAVEGAIIWKLNSEPAQYLLETPKGMQYLGEDYQSVLLENFGKEFLKPLMDFTPLEDIPLVYLNKAANTLEAPRTFTRHLVFSPHLGVGLQQVGFSLPETDFQNQVSGVSSQLGISGEVFLDFKRRFSASTGIIWSRFDSQDFFTYSKGSTQFESDIYMDFSLIQIPILFRYYYDVKPNRVRLYAELGYNYGMANFVKLGLFQAELINGQEVITTQEPMEMGSEYQGLSFGVGIERYFSTYKGITMGIKNSYMEGKNDRSIQNLTFHIGYKF